MFEILSTTIQCSLASFCVLVGSVISAASVSEGDKVWSDEEVALYNKKFHIHNKWESFHYHYPSESFLKYGYHAPGSYVKDFCVVRDEGRWHIFHITGINGQICWGTGNEISFGHCSTDDFQHWIRHRMPLAVDDTPYENEHLWAPYVVKYQDEFYMFYMGAGSGGARIACAVSKDLEKWKKQHKPISAADGRDPFVFQYDNKFILAYTANSSAVNARVLAACYSYDLENWTELDPILKAKHGSPESASIHAFGDQYVLWFNDWGDSDGNFRACYAFSDTPLDFNAAEPTTFAFVKGEDEVPLDLVWSRPHRADRQPPTSIELIAKGNENIWFVAYFRIVGDGFRLFFGELDWNESPAVIREINSVEHLNRILKKIPASTLVLELSGH